MCDEFYNVDKLSQCQWCTLYWRTSCTQRYHTGGDPLPPRAVMYGKQLRKFGETLYAKTHPTHESCVGCVCFFIKQLLLIKIFPEEGVLAVVEDDAVKAFDAAPQQTFFLEA